MSGQNVRTILNLKLFITKLFQICRRMQLKNWSLSNKYKNCFFFGFFEKKTWSENQKSFKIGKIKKFSEERIFIRKKRFQLSKKDRCESWRAENTLVVAGRPSCYHQGCIICCIQPTLPYKVFMLPVTIYGVIYSKLKQTENGQSCCFPYGSKYSLNGVDFDVWKMHFDIFLSLKSKKRNIAYAGSQTRHLSIH